MVTYGVSDKSTGPWLYEAASPDQALAKGRAMWGQVTLFVAEVRVIKPSDGLPNAAVLVGDIRENLVEKYGSGADAMFDDRKVMISIEVAFERLKHEFDTLVDGVYDIDFMVAGKIRSYTGIQTVKVGDFK